jgi:uncharacterized protein YjdB
MLNRTGLNVLLAGLALVVVGCSNTEVGYIQISPATQSLAAGQTVQLTATGIIGHGTHPTSSQDVTNQVIWTSSTPAVATVSSSGLSTAVSIGTATISASMAGSTGATATITVTSGGGGTGGATLASLAIIPSSQSVASPSQTSQFIAIGTTSSGATENLTNQVAWSSSSTQIATISAGGLATGLSKGTTTITAIATISGSAVVTGTASFTVIGGASEPITALSISPGSLSLSATGQTGQFIAFGTSGSTGLQQDVTNSSQLAWSSSIPTIATISASGLATGVSAGSTTITAKWTNPDNSVVSSIATVTVAVTSAPEPLLSLTIIPGEQSVSSTNETGQFIAVGTFSTTPTVQMLPATHDGKQFPITWSSSDVKTATVNSSGLVTGLNGGGTAIIAIAQNPDGTLVTGIATFGASGGSGTRLATLTVVNVGPNSTDWLVTAPSSSGVPNLIHCGPGSQTAGLGTSVCVGDYPIGAPVTLTESPTNSEFGGWSANCENPPGTPNLTSTCTLTNLPDNATVGAIFN